MARFGRFRARRGGMRRFARRVRRVSGMVLVKRGLFHQLTIPDVTSADFDNPLTVDLLECTEAQDEEAESDGTTIADCPLYSRLLKLKLSLCIDPQATTTWIRYILYKKPDGESLVSNLTATAFHSSDDNPTLREIRKNTISNGMLVTNTAGDPVWFSPRIRRSALRRLGSFREGDKISLIIAKNAAGTTLNLSGRMTAYIKANA